MEYAIQLLLPILAGLLLGNWLHQTLGLSSLWTLALAILGMAAGIGVLCKQQMTGKQAVPKIKLPLRSPPQTQEKSSAEAEQSEEKSPLSQGLSYGELLELYKKADQEPPADDFALNELLRDDEEPDDSSEQSPPQKN